MLISADLRPKLTKSKVQNCEKKTYTLINDQWIIIGRKARIVTIFHKTTKRIVYGILENRSKNLIIIGSGDIDFEMKKKRILLECAIETRSAGPISR